MKLIIFLSLFFKLFTNEFEDKIKGKWFTPNKREMIEIYKEGNKYKAKIVWLKYPKYKEGTKVQGKDFSNKEKLDTNNPDKNKRNRKILGLILSEDLVYNPKRNCWIGNIYDPSNGKKYYMEARIKDDKLELKSYVFIFYRTQIWSKKES